MLMILKFIFYVICVVMLCVAFVGIIVLLNTLFDKLDIAINNYEKKQRRKHLKVIK